MGYVLDKSRPIISERLKVGLTLKMAGTRLRNYIDAGCPFGLNDPHSLRIWNTEVARQLGKIGKPKTESTGDLFGS